MSFVRQLSQMAILSTDTGAEKQKLCLELGAEKWIDFKKTTDLVKEIKETCDGLGAHSAIVTSPYSEGYAQVIDYLRPAGTLMAVGLPADAKLECSIFWTVLKVRTINILFQRERSHCVCHRTSPSRALMLGIVRTRSRRLTSLHLERLR